MATRSADNPVGMMAKRLHLNSVMREAPKLSLPGKLVFPSMRSSGHFSMLGLGDIVSDLCTAARTQLFDIPCLTFKLISDFRPYL